MSAHPDDLLSAHVDGELEADEHRRVAEHVAACATCGAARDALVEARTLVRSLPPEDGGPVVDGFLARHRHVVRVGAGFVAAAGSALLGLGLSASTHREPVVPDVASLVAAHTAAAPERVGDVRRELAAPYAAPPGLLGTQVSLSRQAAYDGTDVGAVVYRDGPVAVTVYQEPGRLDRSRLPAGEVRRIAGEPVWFGAGEPVVAVAQKGDLVVTVVSEDRAGVLTAVAGLPEWERSTAWDRLHDAGQRFIEVFALGR